MLDLSLHTVLLSFTVPCMLFLVARGDIVVKRNSLKWALGTWWVCWEAQHSVSLGFLVNRCLELATSQGLLRVPSTLGERQRLEGTGGGCFIAHVSQGLTPQQVRFWLNSLSLSTAC